MLLKIFQLIATIQMYEILLMLGSDFRLVIYEILLGCSSWFGF